MKLIAQHLVNNDIQVQMIAEYPRPGIVEELIKSVFTYLLEGLLEAYRIYHFHGSWYYINIFVKRYSSKCI